MKTTSLNPLAIADLARHSQRLHGCWGVGVDENYGWRASFQNADMVLSVVGLSRAAVLAELAEKIAAV